MCLRIYEYVHYIMHMEESLANAIIAMTSRTKIYSFFHESLEMHAYL